MKHKMLTAYNFEELTSLMDKASEDGWRLYGEINVIKSGVTTSGRRTYYILTTKDINVNDGKDLIAPPLRTET